MHPALSQKYPNLFRFKQFSSKMQNPLKMADSQPQFFQQNLVDPSRKVLYFNSHQNPNCHQQIFYFQLLKLMYQYEPESYDRLLLKINEFIIPKNKQWSFLESLKTEEITVIISDYLQFLGEEEFDIYDSLSLFPIIDQILVSFLRSIIIYGQQCKGFSDSMPVEQIYEFLGGYFQLEITYYNGNCLKFNGSDVFVYIHNQEETYMAFIQNKQHSLNESQLNQSQESSNNSTTFPTDYYDANSPHQMISQINIITSQSGSDSKNTNSKLSDYSYSNSLEKPQNLSNYNPTTVLEKLFKTNKNHITNQSLSLETWNLIGSNSIIKDKEKIIKNQKEKRNNQQRKSLILRGSQIYEIQEVNENESSPLGSPMKRTMEHPQQLKQQALEDIATAESSSGFRRITFSPVQNVENYKQTKDIVYNSKPAMEAKCNKMNSIFDAKSINSMNNTDSFSVISVVQYRHRFPFHKPSINNLHASSNNTSNYSGVNTPISPKHNSNINISKQFTSSLILKQISQPYQTSIALMKSKARRERDNILKMHF